MPNMPHIVSGIVKQSDISVWANANVIIINTNNSESITTTTNSVGRYFADLGNLPSGYIDGHVINIFGGSYIWVRYVIGNFTTTARLREYRFTIDIEINDSSLGQSLVVDSGLNACRNWLGGTATTSPTHAAWGTGTTDPATSDTTLEGEQQRNAFISQRNRGDGVLFISQLETDEANSTAITKAGIFNAAAAGTLYSETEFGAINKTSLFKVNQNDIFTIY